MKVIETYREQDFLWAGQLDTPPASCIWDRGGEQRLVLQALIANAQRSLDAHQEMVNAGIIASLPSDVGNIPWGACFPLPVSSKVQVTHQPRLGLSEQRCSSKDQDCPTD